MSLFFIELHKKTSHVDKFYITYCKKREGKKNVRTAAATAMATQCTGESKKGKAVPIQAWTGPEVSRKLRFPDFVTTAQDGGRLSALRTGRLYPPGNTPGTHFR